MLAAAFGGYLPITFSEDRIVNPAIDLKLIVSRSIGAAKIERIPQQPFRFPGGDTILELFGKFCCITGGIECFSGQYRGSSMMSMSTFAGSRKTRNDHIRPEFADHPHHIG
jgi:hypothetical protein